MKKYTLNSYTKNIKSYIFLSALMLWGSNLNAQEDKEKRYSLELSVTPLATVHISPLQSLTGAASHDSGRYIGGLVRAVYKHTEKWSFGTGLGYSFQKVTTTAALVDPNIQQRTHSSNLRIWEIPVEARFGFLKHFYANAGTLLHFQQNTIQNIDKQTGLGLNIGLGIKVPLSKRFGVSVSPHYKMYSLIPFQSGNHYDRTQLLGIGIGLTM